MKKRSFTGLQSSPSGFKGIKFKIPPLSGLLAISLFLIMAPGFNSPAWGNPVQSLERLQRDYNNQLNQIIQQLQEENNRLKQQAQNCSSTQGGQNQGQRSQGGLWQKLNTPPEPYRSRYPNDPKRAWREYHRERERREMENSR